jgi:hypothetical protein
MNGNQLYCLIQLLHVAFFDAHKTFFVLYRKKESKTLEIIEKGGCTVLWRI